MLEVFILLGVCTWLAWLYQMGSICVATRSETGFYLTKTKPTRASNAVFYILLIILVCFAGLRTRMNDTATYIGTFQHNIPIGLRNIRYLDWSPGANPLFKSYQIVLRTYVTQSGYVFVFLTSLFVVSSNLLFLKKYASDFEKSIFLYLAFAVYAFTLGAMKQSIAIAMAIWSVPMILKGKKLKPVLLILTAMLVHPYVILYFSAFFLTRNVWDKKVGIALGLTLIIGSAFSTVLPAILNFASSLGDEYNPEDFASGGVNIFRLIFYSLVPVLSFMNRKSLRRTGSRILYLSINLSIIAWCFMILASFGGAIFIGRVPAYFDIFSCIALPMVLRYGMETRQNRNFLTFFLPLIFLGYYFRYYSKYMGWGADIYNHISLIELFRSW